MRLYAIVGLLGLLLAATVDAAFRPAAAAGAIAIGRCDRAGYSYDYDTTSGARRRALNECSSNGDGTCEVVVTLHRACGAFAVDGNNSCGARGWAYAPSRGAAENLARSYCAQYGGRNCRISVWVCDGGP